MFYNPQHVLQSRVKAQEARTRELAGEAEADGGEEEEAITPFHFGVEAELGVNG